MKRVFALIVVFFAFAGLAQIVSAGPERLESKEMAAAPAPPPCNWTGFYIGGEAGYGGGTFVWGDPGDNEILTHQKQNGFFGGGELGYNYQFGSSFVLGLEGDFSWSGIGSDNVQSNSEEIKTFNSENDWSGSVALRAGLVSWNNRLLSYLKAGVAFAHFNYDSTNDERPGGGTNVDTFSTGETRTVPLVGFGLEYAMTCHWSIKAEYNHLFLGSEYVGGISIDDGRSENEIYSFDLQQDSVKLGLNYKF